MKSPQKHFSLPETNFNVLSEGRPSGTKEKKVLGQKQSPDEGPSLETSNSVCIVLGSERPYDSVYVDITDLLFL